MKKIKTFILLIILSIFLIGCATTTAYVATTCPPCASIESMYIPVDQAWVKLTIDKHVIYGLEEEKAKIFIGEVKMLLEWARRADKIMKLNKVESDKPIP